MNLLWWVISMAFGLGYNFSPASGLDPWTYGSQRPGYEFRENIGDGIVDDWATFMKAQHIERVLVLLDKDQLAFYQHDLLEQYKKHFKVVAWAPIPDFHIPDADTLQVALNAIADAEQANQRIVVHCSAGMGRTGLILAAWLHARHHLPTRQAIDLVVNTARLHGALRLPLEANPSAADVIDSARLAKQAAQ